jgi:hypothetical protein
VWLLTWSVPRMQPCKRICARLESATDRCLMRTAHDEPGAQQTIINNAKLHCRPSFKKAAPCVRRD